MGDTVPVSWTVENNGNAPTNSNWQDSVYLSSTDTLTGSALWLDSFSAPPNGPLAVQASYTLDENVTIPTGASTGSQYLLFVTNSNGGQAVNSTAGEVDAVPISLYDPRTSRCRISRRPQTTSSARTFPSLGR